MKIAHLVCIIQLVVAVFASAAAATAQSGVEFMKATSVDSRICKQRKAALKLNGGAAGSHGRNIGSPDVASTITRGRKAWAMLGVFQVIAILGIAIRRLVPIALQPFVNQDFLAHHWAMFALSVVTMAYVEGYRAFHLKFAPLVVNRSFGLADRKGFFNCLFAGPFSMGLIGATKKRAIVSWGVSIGVFCVVFLVKKLPYPWRPIVDAGVISGLTVGSMSILVHCTRALLTGKLPDIDPCF